MTDTDQSPRPRRPRRRLVVAAGAVLAIAAVVALRPGSTSSADRPADAASSATASVSSSPAAPSTTPGTTSAAPAGPDTGTTWAPTTPDPDLSDPTAAVVPAPVSVSIPSIGMAGNLIDLATDPATGVLVPPVAYDVAGWFTGGPRPGGLGPAVIAGHVDSKAGPGVFFKLRDVAAGDKVTVTRADGSVASFTVYAVGKYAKTEFPTAEVYGPTPDAQLRVITCGGSFDYSARSYRDNIVVYARLD